MAGIQLVQAGGAGTLNGAGVQDATFTTAITGLGATASITGAVPTSLTWALSSPRGSRAKILPSFTALAIAIDNFDFTGWYTLVAVDQNGTTYILKLLVQQKVTTQRGQAITPAYVAASQVEQPQFGESLFCDSQDGGRLKTKKTTGLVASILSALSGIVDLAKSAINWTQDTPLGTDTFAKYQPTETNAVAWVIGRGEFSNPGTGNPRHDQVWTQGWNLSPGGAGRIIGGAEVAFGDGYEYYFQPGDSTTRVCERHMYFVTSAGFQRRPFSWSFSHTTGFMLGSLAADRFDFVVDAGGNPMMTITASIVELGLNATPILFRSDLNNSVFFGQLNAAGSSTVEIVRVDASNRVAISPAQAPTRVGGPFMLAALSVGNLPSGGAIGTAASTVDIFSSFDVNQTTAGQTISLPSPTDTTTGRECIISNVGTQSFTFLGAAIAAGASARAKWTGAAYSRFI